MRALAPAVRSLHRAALLLGLGLVASCGGSGAPYTEQPAVLVEVVYARQGGLCVGPNGLGELCSHSVTVRDDGTYTAVSGSADPEGGSVSEGAASLLAAVLDRALPVLTERPFTGMCPTAYDGQEVTYTLRRIPTGPGAELADADVRTTSSCVHDWGHPAAREALSSIREVWEGLELPD